MKPTERDAAASAEAGLAPRPRRASDKPITKRKGPKGPNPLSVKKKSTKHKASSGSQAPLASATAAPAVNDGQAGKARRPRRRPKADAPAPAVTA